MPLKIYFHATVQSGATGFAQKPIKPKTHKGCET